MVAICRLVPWFYQSRWSAMAGRHITGACSTNRLASCFLTQATMVLASRTTASLLSFGANAAYSSNCDVFCVQHSSGVIDGRTHQIH